VRRPASGDPCPDFSLPADDGTVVSLESLAGKRFVLYFYPEDDTPGCTTQACTLRDEFAALRSLSVEVFGISPDSVASHVAFRARYALPFRLLADVDHAAAEAFGVWIHKSVAGSDLSVMGNERTTFVIGPDGRIETVLAEVRPEEHADQLLRALH
jgi:peroxiredoxin Q/BCP